MKICRLINILFAHNLSLLIGSPQHLFHLTICFSWVICFKLKFSRYPLCISFLLYLCNICIFYLAKYATSNTFIYTVNNSPSAQIYKYNLQIRILPGRRVKDLFDIFDTSLARAHWTILFWHHVEIPVSFWRIVINIKSFFLFEQLEYTRLDSKMAL